MTLNPIWHIRSLKNAYYKLGKKEQERWIWWNLSIPATSEKTLSEIIDDEPEGVIWHAPQQTKQLIEMMSEVNLAKLEDAKKRGLRAVGTIYKRTRRDRTGRKVQRAEVRFDGIAGCLRTPAGGSSRQLIIVVKGKQVKTRLISTRETARLMGLEESYILPEKYNEAYHLTGDGVVVPVVRYLSEQIFEPILLHNQRKKGKGKAA